MPELPEIETIKRSLEKHIVGHKITSFMKFRESLRYKLAENLALLTENTVITNISRIAKYLVLDLNNDNSLVFHLGMTGRLTCKQADYDFQKHDHIVLILGDNSKLVFADSRRFGMVYGCKSNELFEQKYFSNNGLEPFSASFNAEYLQDCFKNRKLPIKSAIMDNRIVVGVGNIYASESLFLSKINPLRPAGSLTKAELLTLIESIITVLNQAIDAGGTTLRDFVSGDSTPGYFKQKLNVYDRKGLECYSCRGKIIKIVQSGRATYFCSECQRGL